MRCRWQRQRWPAAASSFAPRRSCIGSARDRNDEGSLTRPHPGFRSADKVKGCCRTFVNDHPVRSLTEEVLSPDVSTSRRSYAPRPRTPLKLPDSGLNSTSCPAASDLKPEPWIIEKWTKYTLRSAPSTLPRPFALLKYSTRPRTRPEGA